jgi:hypothetical protein
MCEVKETTVIACACDFPNIYLRNHSFVNEPYRTKAFASTTNLSLSLTLHDTNSPSHDVAWQKKSSCPQKE